MKLSDFVIHYLADLGIKHVFVVTGGYAVNLIDSLHNEPRLQHICVHHEQVAAMAAEGYARFAGLSAVITTNAPGALNLLNGIDGAWNDSIPCIFICGQVNRSRWNRTEGKAPGREIVDIVSIVESNPLVKYAAYVDDPTEIKYCLDRAVYMARKGRPGPVLLDVPLDIQKAEIEPTQLSGFDIPQPTRETGISSKVIEAWKLIQNAKRPVILLGGGLRLSNTIDQARELIEKLDIPAVVTWCAFDNLGHDHSNYLGNIGSYGNRRANYTIQNSDLVLILGARLNVRQTGGEPRTFAPHATKIKVDLEDPEKASVKIDLPINCDLREFFDWFLKLSLKRLDIDEWRRNTQYYRDNFTEVLPEYYKQKNSVNVYVFMKKLSKIVPAETPVLVDCGGNLIWMMQAYDVKAKQRVFSNMGLSSMGYSLAASIGVCFATDKKPVVCLIGDGGLQVHIQEMQTIKYHNLPIKIFVVNNKSYGIIKQTIESWFEIDNTTDAEKRYLAVSGKDGYSCPDFMRIAGAYGIPATSINNHDQLCKINEVLDWEGPVVCDVKLDEHQKIAPRLEFGRPLEDQHPLLDREVLSIIMGSRSSQKNQPEDTRSGEIEGI